jgi:ankyrin repeat protein
MSRRTLVSVPAICGLWVAALVSAAPASTALVNAAKQGQRQEVRRLLRDGADVDTALGDGMTALHWAAQAGDAELTNILLWAGANVAATTRIGGYTPLLIASNRGDAPTIEALVRAQADPNRATTNGTTPLMLAAASGSVEAVRLLIDHGANVNARENVKGETALIFAAAYGRAEVVGVLTAHGADTSVTTKVIDLAAFAKEEQERAAARRAGKAVRDQTGADPPGVGATPSPQIPGVTRQYSFAELVGHWGGLAPLHMAARQGQIETTKALLDAGADINQPSAGDHMTPLVIAIVNGHFDLATILLDKGADPNLAADNGVRPLYAVLNCQWASKAYYPQPRAYEQQQTTYLALLQALLDKGADPNARLTRKVWYSQYNIDHSGVDESGATPFWRAAYAADVDAMKLLVAHGADPNLPTVRTPGRVRMGADQREAPDVSFPPPVQVGGPAVPPLLAAAGVGYGEGTAANVHRFSPSGMLAAVKYLVEELHADVNARDHDGNTPTHNAAARGDNEMILYLVSKGADVTAVNREGKTTVDMANGPVERIQPFPETIKLLEGLGARNNHRCVSC